MKASIDTGLPPPPAQAPRWLLLGGLLAGAALAAYGLADERAGRSLPPDAVARVNQQLILRSAWLRAVAAVAADRRTPLTAADQRHILERLIDEELLVQHGVAVGLVERDARLRGTLVSEVMLAASATGAEAPTDAAAAQFYAQHRDFFAPTARLRVAAWIVDADGTRRAFQPAVPDALLPPAKLQAYLGPSLTARALTLAPGEVSEALTSGAQRVVLELRERQAAAPPPFAQVRTAVRAEMKRRADEAAVRTLLAELRGSNDVIIAPALP